MIQVMVVTSVATACKSMLGNLPKWGRPPNDPCS